MTHIFKMEIETLFLHSFSCKVYYYHHTSTLKNIFSHLKKNLKKKSFQFDVLKTNNSLLKKKKKRNLKKKRFYERSRGDVLL